MSRIIKLADKACAEFCAQLERASPDSNFWSGKNYVFTSPRPLNQDIFDNGISVVIIISHILVLLGAQSDKEGVYEFLKSELIGS